MDSWVWITGFGFVVWIPGFGIMGLHSWVWIPGIGFLGLGSWVWIPGFGFLGLESQEWIPGLRFLGLESWVGVLGLDSWIWTPGLNLLPEVIIPMRFEPNLQILCRYSRSKLRSRGNSARKPVLKRNPFISWRAHRAEHYRGRVDWKRFL